MDISILTRPALGYEMFADSIIFALPSRKVKGLYLALTTLAAHFIIIWACRYVPGMMGKPWGTLGIEVASPAIGALCFDTVPRFYWLAMIFAVIMTYFAKSIARSGLGRAFIAIRDNDIAAESIGINIFRYKVVAFAICSAYGAVAGSLSAYFTGWVSTEARTLMDGIWFVGMAIIGGLGTAVGPILGVVFLSSLKQVMLRAAPWTEASIGLQPGAGPGILIFAFGLVILLFLIFEPRGLAHRWEIIKWQIRLWPYSY